MTKTDSSKSKNQEKLIEQMAEAGVHFGHSKSRKNPKIEPFVYGLRNNIVIIDLQSTAKKLEEALKFIQDTVSTGGKILFVGLRPQSSEITKKTAEECGMPYVSERWLGGTLTNFKTIRKRVDHLQDLEKKKKAGELKKYTKREQMLFDEEITKLNHTIGGLKELNKLPAAILVLSIKHCATAVNESIRKKIPVIGLADTDSNPTLIDYPIPSNDDVTSALEFMLNQIKDCIIKNKK